MLCRTAAAPGLGAQRGRPRPVSRVSPPTCAGQHRAARSSFRGTKPGQQASELVPTEYTEYEYNGGGLRISVRRSPWFCRRWREEENRRQLGRVGSNSAFLQVLLLGTTSILTQHKHHGWWPWNFEMGMLAKRLVESASNCNVGTSRR